MGLDAYVPCNCFRDGHTTLPPFPLTWLKVGEDGEVDFIEAHDSVENGIKLDEWRQSCCPHGEMEFAAERISNWPGYRLFQAALVEVGWSHFPVLQNQLPDINGGSTPAVESRKALRELDSFSTLGAIGHRTVLVDSDSGDELRESVTAYGGIFIWSASMGVNIGVDAEGVFVVQAETGQELFRAASIRQSSRDGTAITAETDDVIWEDLDTGRTYPAGIAIHGKEIPWDDGIWHKPGLGNRFEYPSQVHVEQRTRCASDFNSITRALRSVFAASIETGNPVHWC